MTFPEKTSLRPSMYLVLVFAVLTGLDVLASPLVSVKALGNAGYFAPLVAVVPFFAIIAIIFALQKKFPGKSVLQYSSQILGRVPTVIINLLVIIFWRLYTTIVTRDIMSLVSTHMLLRTPLWFFSIIGLLGVIYLAYHGIESVSRFVAFVFLPATIVIILVFFSALPYINVHQLLPVFNFGIKDIAKGALGQSYLYFPMLLLFMITPFTKDLRSARRFTMGAVALSAFGFLTNTSVRLAFSALPDWPVIPGQLWSSCMW